MNKLVLYIVKGVKSDATGKIAEYLRQSSKDNFMLTVEPIKSKRSTAQNRLYWLLLGLIVEASQKVGGSEFDGWNSQDFHEGLSEKYLRGINPRTKKMRTRSTTSLTIEEFNVYLETVLVKILVQTFQGTFDSKDNQVYLDAMRS